MEAGTGEEEAGEETRLTVGLSRRFQATGPVPDLSTILLPS